MTTLLTIIPCFGYEEMQPKLAKWFGRAETRERLTELGVTKLITIFPRVGAFLDKGLKIVGRIGKGKVIRIALETNKGKRLDYVICMDGDGQIPFGSIFEICFQLRSQPIDAILACRKGEFGISEYRKLIEKFELFLVSQLYSVDLPDGQCGCWGFRGELLNEIELEAEGFEIELDFLVELLRTDTQFGFIEITVVKGDETTFSVKSHKDKIVFVSQKLEIGKGLIEALATRFEEVHQTPLPAEYKEVLSSLSEEMVMRYPICFNGTCEKCPHRD